MGRPFLFIAVACTVLLTACAIPRTRVVLLPQDNGKPSSVIVHTDGGDVTLSEPYQRASARLGSQRPPRLDQVDPARLRKDSPLLFDLAPRKAAYYTLYFDAGGTVLTPESMAVLEEALSDALTRTGSDIVITGHTDTLDTGPRNDALSALRAREVRQLFIDRQFPPERIESAGRGERELAVPTADEVAEPRNRRVVIEVR